MASAEKEEEKKAQGQKNPCFISICPQCTVSNLVSKSA